MNAANADPVAVGELRATLQAWLAQAHDVNGELRGLDRPLDSEWLCGRICALREVLELLDGRRPDVDVRGHVFAAEERATRDP